MRRPTLSFTSTILCCTLLFSCSPERILKLELSETAPPTDIGALVSLKGGWFMMGAPKQEGAWEEGSPAGGLYLKAARPEHREYAPPFAIGKYEVTAQEYCDFLNQPFLADKDMRKFILVDETSTIVQLNKQYVSRPGYENAPALHTQLYGAREYCRWLSRERGEMYRLPTEIEWEFTARGEEGRTYPWGEAPPLGRCFLAIHYLDHPRQPMVTTVGAFPSGATPEGVHDLIGSASEWTANVWYEYSQDSIGDVLNDYVQFAWPELDYQVDIGQGAIPSVTMVPLRGGQYIDLSLKFVRTGWLRYDTSAANGATGGRSQIGHTFRVVRISDEERTIIERDVRVDSDR